MSRIIAIIVVAKRWNEVKWFLFFHFNIRDKRDDDVNILVGKKWDVYDIIQVITRKHLYV